MVNQRFWGRECRQVLGHLQPPQMSLEDWQGQWGFRQKTLQFL